MKNSFCLIVIGFIINVNIGISQIKDASPEYATIQNAINASHILKTIIDNSKPYNLDSVSSVHIVSG